MPKKAGTKQRPAKGAGKGAAPAKASPGQAAAPAGRARIERLGQPKAKIRHKPTSPGVGSLPVERGSDIQPRRQAPQAYIPPPAVPTNDKPRKNHAGLNKSQLEHFRELLLSKRRELVGDMSQMEREALRSASGTNISNLPVHMADLGTDNYEQEFTLGLVEKDRQLLREINQALAKIQDGTYGICEGTGKPISRPRLEAQPWARFSIEFARAMEQGRLR
jgi:RNA polymerase-binding protein DksA